VPPGPAGQPAIPLDPATIALRFTVGPAEVTLGIAKVGVEKFAENVRRRLRRRQRSAVGPRYYAWPGFGYSTGYGNRYKFEPTYPAQVAGYPGLARVMTVKARRQAPQRVIQMYAIVGPYAMTLTVPETQAAYDPGPVTLYPPAPPVITPVVRMPAASADTVGEKLTMDRGTLRLTGIVTPGRITMSTQDFALSTLADLRSRTPDLAVDNWQPDVFFGGLPCVRNTFLRGGLSGGSAVRSEFWWAGVVGGRGVQVFVSGTKSIIGLDDARLRDVLVVLPPD
jgi:hypothetical protein